MKRFGFIFALVLVCMLTSCSTQAEYKRNTSTFDEYKEQRLKKKLEVGEATVKEGPAAKKSKEKKSSPKKDNPLYKALFEEGE